MRKLISLLGPASLALLAVVACEDDPTPAGPDFTFDAGLADFYVPPTNTPDAQADAPVVPSVSVTVVDGKGPAAGVRVVFHDATGAVIETKLTGDDGKATITGTVPAMASALLATGTQHHIVTWTGVESGDNLLARLSDPPSEDPVGTYNVTLPGSFADAGASSHSVKTPCGDRNVEPTGPASVPMYSHCSRPQNAILVTAFDVDNGTIGHSFKKAVAPPAGGGAIDVATSDWRAPSTFGVNIEHAQPNRSFNLEVYEIADGYGYYNDTQDSDGSGYTFKTATGFADAYQANVRFYGGAGTSRGIAERTAPAESVSLDYESLLPILGDPNANGTNARRPSITWTGSTTATDGGLVRLRYYGPGESSYAWTLVVPPGTTSVTAPAMPPEADSSSRTRMLGSMHFPDLPQIVFVEADVLPGYALFRQQQGSFIDTELDFAYEFPMFPINGTFRTTTVMQPPR